MVTSPPRIGRKLNRKASITRQRAKEASLRGTTFVLSTDRDATCARLLRSLAAITAPSGIPYAPVLLAAAGFRVAARGRPSLYLGPERLAPMGAPLLGLAGATPPLHRLWRYVMQMPPLQQAVDGSRTTRLDAATAALWLRRWGYGTMPRPRDPSWPARSRPRRPPEEPLRSGRTLP
ncbi:MAG: hypothetical protein BWY85_00699 [Firmicutes bacterium ADurb.Bin506]|nr:MAG: hypothetical protein BWY85_00699 [Firmicutes bacterium ADurb.Bin506]